jgi:uncharacterized protein (TIGR00369 family)
VTERLEAPVDDGFCFGCGHLSEIGLHLRFDVLDDASVESRVTLDRRYQGWRGVAHGGVVAVLLDEAMAYAAAARGFLGVTADLRLRFRRAVPVGEALIVRGRVLSQRRNVFGIEADVHAAAGVLLAAGEGSFVSRGRLAPGQRLGEPQAPRGG